MSYPNWTLIIGEIVAPFGRAGEVKVRLETDFPERFEGLEQVCIRWSNGDARLYPVESVRFHKGQVLLKLRGVTSIEEADTLRNTLVQVKATDAVPLQPDEYYIHDLLGCNVVTVEGRSLGAVTATLRGGANDVYVVGEGKSEVLLPAIKEVIREVNLRERKIVVAPTPGLLSDEPEE